MERVSLINTRVFKCVRNEQVTLQFNPRNTSLRVTYRLSNEISSHVVQGDTLTLTINRDLMEYRVFFHFINESGTGGSYQISLSGSNGGNFTDDPAVLQAGDLVPVRTYTFFV